MATGIARPGCCASTSRRSSARSGPCFDVRRTVIDTVRQLIYNARMATLESPSGHTSADSDELAGFGYKQELDRSLSSFSSFAAGFSYISILTGVFELFGFGFGFGGPAVWWSWPIVFIGQMAVALCFAE